MTRHIVYVLSSTVRGGVEEHVLSLVRHLDRSRFAVTLVCPKALVQAMASDIAALGIHTVPLEVNLPTSPRAVRALVALYRLLRRLRPDIVNCHMLRATVAGAPIARLAGVPLVIATNHGPDPWRRGAIKNWHAIDRWVDRSVDRTIAVCASAKQHLVRKGLAADKIVVVNNGRELDTFTPMPRAESMAVRSELAVADDEPLIGIIARLDMQKGHRYALDAMPDVLQRYPRARLLLVGDGNLREDLRSQAAALGVADRILFAGFRSDVRRMLGASDIVALPSLWEGLPLTLIEALAMQKPVVATAVNGSQDVILDDETGVLVPPGDSRALAKGILRLLDDPEAASRLAAQGRAHVLASFDIRRQMAETVRVYESAAARR
jgi:glycosyltransferase involved in cell wall biosynthesis